jgi:hypothetical protein
VENYFINYEKFNLPLYHLVNFISHIAVVKRGPFYFFLNFSSMEKSEEERKEGRKKESWKV